MRGEVKTKKKAIGKPIEVDLAGKAKEFLLIFLCTVFVFAHDAIYLDTDRRGLQNTRRSGHGAVRHRKR